MNLIDEYGGIEEAIAAVVDAAEEDGTESILDMFSITETEEYNAVCPLQPSELMDIFGTVDPSVKQVKSVLLVQEGTDEWEQFWESIGRGTGRCIVCYEDKRPVELFFAGYSFD
jgi:hypothetical protein